MFIQFLRISKTFGHVWNFELILYRGLTEDHQIIVTSEMFNLESSYILAFMFHDTWTLNDANCPQPLEKRSSSARLPQYFSRFGRNTIVCSEPVWTGRSNWCLICWFNDVPSLTTVPFSESPLSVIWWPSNLFHPIRFSNETRFPKRNSFYAFKFFGTIFEELGFEIWNREWMEGPTYKIDELSLIKFVVTNCRNQYGDLETKNFGII